MKLTRQNLGNVVIAAVAVLLFASFVVLGTRGGHKNNKLATVGTTTSTERVTTTTEPETTTSSTELATTTTTAASAATTTTVKKSTTGTTAVHTTTTATGKFTCPARGPVSHEPNDNSLSFTHAQDGSVSENSSGGSNSGVVITIHAARADVSGDPAKVKFILKIENKSTNHCVYFPTDANNQDTANISVTLTGLDPFVVSGGAQPPLQPGEALMITQERTTPTGTFSASVNCDVNYS